MMQSTSSQKGAALVVAMIVVSLVAVLAVSMSVQYNFSVQRVANQMIAQQAYNYLRGTEAIAHKVMSLDLMMDRDDGVTSDHFSEVWAQDVPPFVIEEGSYTARLTDLQGHFNINSLRKPNLVFPAQQVPPVVPYTIEQGIFMRLLQAVGDDEYAVDEAQAQAITEAVVDYLDANQDASGFNCGEDDSYQGISDRPSHRTPDMPLTSVSELRLVCNMPIELYERLRPYLTVWPLNGLGVINLNTAPVPVLRSVLVLEQDVARLNGINNTTSFQPPAPLGLAELEALVEKQRLGYGQLSELQADIPGLQLWPKAPLGLYSNYFMLESTATIGNVTQVMNSVISREGGNIEFIARSMGSL